MDRIIFGTPCVDAVSSEVERANAKRVLVFASSSLNRGTQAVEELRLALGSRHVKTIDKFGSFADCKAATVLAADARADFIVAVGGGTIIDTAKIVALSIQSGFAKRRDEAQLVPDYDADLPLFEIENSPVRIRVVAVPTTLSSTAYSAQTAWLENSPQLTGPSFQIGRMPDVTVIDPEVTLHTPEKLWFGSGMGAIGQGISAILSPEGNPLVDGAALQGIRLTRLGLVELRRNPQDVDARRHCLYGAWLASFGMHTSMKFSIIHAIAGALKNNFGIPHHLSSGPLLPALLDHTLSETRDTQKLIGEQIGTRRMSAATGISRLLQKLGLPRRLSELGIDRSNLQIIARTTMTERYPLGQREKHDASDILKILDLAA
ncbi:iron-containing alcohol dehydrogenase [Afipia sp. DC4300-2b1]|uniref:iron-containing alcohol dehydrogenase n=1 Tax=Afipia sp. DC4300-2b1 TaxID=2804672 RepID=UPI003CFA926E